MSDHRVDHAVAVVVERDRRLTVPVDDEVGVLEDLPSPFDGDGQDEPEPERPAASNEPQESVEGEAVDDVRERVPVGQVLRVLRAVHDAVPQLDVTALADRDAAHGQQDGRGQGNEPARHQQVTPFDVIRRRHVSAEDICHVRVCHATRAPRSPAERQWATSAVVAPVCAGIRRKNCSITRRANEGDRSRSRPATAGACERIEAPRPPRGRRARTHSS